jgi:hypothetical protein
MLAIMLDPRYKGLQCISKFVGPVQAKAIVADYDKHILLPLLQQAWAALNLVPEHNKEVNNDEDVPEVDEFILFGAAALLEEAMEGAIVKELYLFRRLVIDKEDLHEGPLNWWKHNEAKFPNVGFLARQYLGIPGSQIETERIFSVAGVFTNLQRTKLGIDKSGEFGHDLHKLAQ